MAEVHDSLQEEHLISTQLLGAHKKDNYNLQLASITNYYDCSYVSVWVCIIVVAIELESVLINAILIQHVKFTYW